MKRLFCLSFLLIIVSFCAMSQKEPRYFVPKKFYDLIISGDTSRTDLLCPLSYIHKMNNTYTGIGCVGEFYGGETNYKKRKIYKDSIIFEMYSTTLTNIEKESDKDNFWSNENQVYLVIYTKKTSFIKLISKNRKTLNCLFVEFIEVKKKPNFQRNHKNIDPKVNWWY